MCSASRAVCLVVAAGSLAAGMGAGAQGAAAPRPGNVFFVDELVRVPATAAMREHGARWELSDIDGRASVRVDGMSDTLSPGRLPPGWYEVRAFNYAGDFVDRTTLAVLQPLGMPVPGESPVCVDTAAAWFAKNDPEAQAKHFQLAKLAGVSWVRDRYTWGELMPSPGETAERTSYDTSAALAAGHGLQVLQVFHGTPEWAQGPGLDPDNPGIRFPRDLFDLHAFCTTLAERYRGRVRAWEPWNEANISVFGGHLIDEMCSLQKAAWWAFKTADADVTVCWNCYAGSGSALHQEGVVRNEAWPYFDTYNIHTYGAPASYLSSFDAALEGACGRPLWLTECGIRLPAATDAPWGDLGREDAATQARFIPRSYASSLFAGVDRHFFFILGNYIERGVQFGVLRRDFTPRPGYVALAVVGRMLAGAEPLGRRIYEDTGVHVYAFRCGVESTARDVLVVWAEEEVAWPLPEDLEVVSMCDLYGRRPPQLLLKAGPDAVYVTLPEGKAGKLGLDEPVEARKWRKGEPSPVVMQVRMPQETALIQRQAYEVPAGEEVTVPLHVYNFGTEDAHGRLRVADVPKGWQVRIEPERVKLAANGSGPVSLTATLPVTGEEALRGGWLTVRGKFDGLEDSILSFRLVARKKDLDPARRIPLPRANQAERWQENIVADGSVTHRAEDGGVAAEMKFAKQDPWCFPRLVLEPDERPPADVHGLEATVQLREGQGRVRVLFTEDDGAVYVAETNVPPDSREAHKVTVLFDDAQWGSFSKADGDGALRPEDVVSVLIGVNAEPDAHAVLWLKDLAWVGYETR